jgi:DNA repair exonuclease SbcCD nuclease subunit
MTKIVHTADLHIQQPGDVRWQALEAIISLAQQEKADVLTISGDLFDHNFSATQARGKIRQLFNDNGFKTIILPGNHDQQSFQQGFFFGQEAKILNQEQNKYTLTSVESTGRAQPITIYGLPFQHQSSQAVLQELVKLNQQLDPKQTNILLFHGELLDHFFAGTDFGQEGDKRYMPIKLSYFAELNFDYVLAGHFHSNFSLHQLPNQRLESGGYFVYPGSPVSVTRKETGPRSVAIIELGVKAKQAQVPQQHQLKTMHYQQLEFIFQPGQAAATQQQILTQLQEIQQQAPQAQILLKVSGYLDQEQTEQDLAQQLSAWQEQFSITAIDNQVKSISQIMTRPVYQLFMQKLQKKANSPEEKEQLRQTLLTAMMQNHD